MNILVSACLLGVPCRYNGEGALQADIADLMSRHTLIPVCPEILAGLPTPREAAEIRHGRVLFKGGADATGAFQRGAAAALDLARLYRCSWAILKERSPSCGFGQIYDGSFSGRLIPGNGVCAQLLAEAGLMILGESQISRLP